MHSISAQRPGSFFTSCLENRRLCSTLNRLSQLNRPRPFSLFSCVLETTPTKRGMRSAPDVCVCQCVCVCVCVREREREREREKIVARTWGSNPRHCGAWLFRSTLCHLSCPVPCNAVQYACLSGRSYLMKGENSAGLVS